MNRLRYKTNADSLPQGKTRVFFACHPEDHDLYFQAMSEELLSRQNCALWYYPPQAADASAEGLEDMQLMVVAVTRRLLTEPSPAADIYIPFARERHIPILPVMREPDLAGPDYKRLFGDMQYLSAARDDPTAESYGEQLSRYLDSELMGDELRERILRDFRFSVFLSYRKKDRREARALMSAVHDIRGFDDVAIWYDEYLVPGESFNDHIRSVIEACGFMLLLVTPNMAGESNYVSEKEYPAATASGTPVLPVEAAATDREALDGLFPGLPPCVSMEDTGALAEALGSASEGFAHIGGPEHDYLMGMAYLGGVNVETDRERGARLLTRAAEGGSREAMSRLADMYRRGSAAPRDLITSALWRRRACDALKAAGEDADLCFELWALGDTLKEAGELRGAQEAYLELLEADPNKEIPYMASTGQEKLGDVAMAAGRMEEAFEHYVAALHMRVEMAERFGADMVGRDLAISYEKLGDLMRAMGNMSEAESFYSDALRARRELMRSSGDDISRRDMAVSLAAMGDAAMAEWRYDEAYEHYEGAYSILKALAHKGGSEERRDLAVILMRLGDLDEAAGDLESAEMSFDRALLLLTEDASEPTAELGIAYEKAGNMKRARGELEAAVELYLRSAAATGAVARESGDRKPWHDLAVCFGRLGEAQVLLGDGGSARGSLIQSADIFRSLVSASGLPADRRGYMQSITRLAIISDDASERRELLSSARAMAVELYELDPSPAARGDLEVIDRLAREAGI